jgi:hypothetical protein
MIVVDAVAQEDVLTKPAAKLDSNSCSVVSGQCVAASDGGLAGTDPLTT